MSSYEDAELDRAFKPRARPQSIMAIDFGNSLDEMFMIDNSLTELTLSIDKKHQSISFQSAELEALQEQIRKADELIERRRSGVFSGSWSSIAAANSSPHKRVPLPQSVMEETSSDDEGSEQDKPKKAPPPARARVTPTRARSSTTSNQSLALKAATGSPVARRPATSQGPPRRKPPSPETSSESESASTTDSDSDAESTTNPLTQATDSSEEEKVEPKKAVSKKPISPKRTVKV